MERRREVNLCGTEVWQNHTVSQALRQIDYTGK